MAGTEGTQAPSASTAASTTRVCVATSSLGTDVRSAQPRAAGDAAASRAASTVGASQRALAKRTARRPQLVPAQSMAPTVNSGRPPDDGGHASAPAARSSAVASRTAAARP